MASTNTLCKKLLNVKGAVVESHNFYTDADGVVHLRINARPSAWHMNDCPYCGKHCPRYDRATPVKRLWRSLDFGGILVEIECETHRVSCPEHGVVTAAVPWAYPRSRFTRDFDLTVAWLATHLPRSAVSNYMRIDWETVGHCITRTLNDIEPERSRRLDGLVHIGIDETSYKKGHKYITVVVNHDTNTVVWASEGHGKSVLEKFYQSLTPEQLSSIKVVTGDGARWITDCVNEYTPGCERCVDSFHVVEWAMEALDEVRREAWREARSKAEAISGRVLKKAGRARTDDPVVSAINRARTQANDIKTSTFALGKAPENLTENQRTKLEMIQINNPRLYRAYRLKESLRLLLKLDDVQEAEKELNHWLQWASHSQIPSFKELYQKIKRHKEHILNTIRFGMSNARIESTNNKIKLLIRKAYGFRNIQNMLDMVYLVCSNLTIPLPNRKPKAAKP